MSGGASKPKRLKAFPASPFVAHSLVMLESIAFRSLSWHARKILDVLEREHMAHGGYENGKLKATRAQMKAAGVGKDSISTGLIELEALGFIQIVRQGGKSVGDVHQPNLYRLTYLKGRIPEKNGKPSAREYITDEWFDVTNEADVRRRIEARRQRWEDEHGARVKLSRGVPAEASSIRRRVA